MRRDWRLAAALVLAVLACSASAHAQYGRYLYPRGYADYGWQGWGTSTVQGEVARGLGVLAAGQGAYNEQNARARAINAETAARWNQHLWQSQQEVNRRHQEKMARDKRNNARSRDEIARRLRDNPTPSDIARGDALNVALDEITAPNVDFRGTKGASAKVAGTSIRDIPFQYASAAITTSMDQLTKAGPPPALKAETFAADRAALKAIAADLRKQDEEQGRLDPGTLQKARDILQGMRTKVETTIPKNTPERRDAENYLKGLFGLTRLLETPAINVLLAGVAQRPDTNLGELLTFMKAFNLRFGVASTPRQQAIYNEIYPLLVALRQEIEASGAATTTAASPPPDAASRPGHFFSGMDFEDLSGKSAPNPPGPGPR